MGQKKRAEPAAARSTGTTDVVTRVAAAAAISQRAYALFQARGGQHGHDVEDWLVAEAELVRGIYTDGFNTQ